MDLDERKARRNQLVAMKVQDMNSGRSPDRYHLSASSHERALQAQLAHARHFVQRIRFTQYLDQIRHGELDEALLGERMAASGAEFDKAMEDTANGLYDDWVSKGAGRDHDFVAEYERLKAKRDS